MTPGWPRGDLRLAVAVVLLLGLVYNLNLRAINSRDTHVAQYVAFSLAAEGRSDLAAFPETHDTGIVKGSMTRRDGRVYSNYPIVPSVMAAPLYWMALQTRSLDRDRPDQVAIEAIGKVAASGMTALACGVLCLVLRRRLGAATAFGVAIAAGVATPLWSSASQALWSHGPAALWLSVGWLALEPDGGGARRSAARDLIGGAALALAVACRPLLVFFAVGACIALLVRRAGWRWVAAGAGAVALAVGVYNVLTFGSIVGGASQLESAAVHQAVHAVSSAWGGNPAMGLAGILISPSRGIIIFMPVALLALAGARRLVGPDRRAERWTLVYPTLAFVLAWSTYTVWWSGHSFGPRYAADLALPLAALAGWALESMAWSTAGVRRTAVVVVLAWSIGVQALGAFAYPAGDWNGTPVDVDRAHNRLWDWRDSQINRTGTGLFSTDRGR